DPEVKAKLGAFLVLDQEGRPRLDTAFYAEVTADEESGDADSDDPAAVQPEPVRSRPAGLPRALVDELAIQRRDILAAHVAADPPFALDLAIFLIADRSRGRSYERCGSSLVAMPATDPLSGFETPGARATIALTG